MVRGEAGGSAAHTCQKLTSGFTLWRARNTLRRCSGRTDGEPNSAPPSRQRSPARCGLFARRLTDGRGMALDTGAFWCGAFRIELSICPPRRAYGS